MAERLLVRLRAPSRLIQTLVPLVSPQKYRLSRHLMRRHQSMSVYQPHLALVQKRVAAIQAHEGRSVSGWQPSRIVWAGIETAAMEQSGAPAVARRIPRTRVSPSTAQMSPPAATAPEFRPAPRIVAQRPGPEPAVSRQPESEDSPSWMPEWAKDMKRGDDLWRRLFPEGPSFLESAPAAPTPAQRKPQKRTTPATPPPHIPSNLPRTRAWEITPGSPSVERAPDSSASSERPSEAPTQRVQTETEGKPDAEAESVVHPARAGPLPTLAPSVEVEPVTSFKPDEPTAKDESADTDLSGTLPLPVLPLASPSVQARPVADVPAPRAGVESVRAETPPALSRKPEAQDEKPDRRPASADPPVLDAPTMEPATESKKERTEPPPPRGQKVELAETEGTAALTEPPRRVPAQSAPTGDPPGGEARPTRRVQASSVSRSPPGQEAGSTRARPRVPVTGDTQTEVQEGAADQLPRIPARTDAAEQTQDAAGDAQASSIMRQPIPSVSRMPETLEADLEILDEPMGADAAPEPTAPAEPPAEPTATGEEAAPDVIDVGDTATPKAVSAESVPSLSRQPEAPEAEKRPPRQPAPAEPRARPATGDAPRAVEMPSSEVRSKPETVRAQPAPSVSRKLEGPKTEADGHAPAPPSELISRPAQVEGAPVQEAQTAQVETKAERVVVERPPSVSREPDLPEVETEASASSAPDEGAGVPPLIEPTLDVGTPAPVPEPRPQRVRIETSPSISRQPEEPGLQAETPVQPPSAPIRSEDVGAVKAPSGRPATRPTQVRAETAATVSRKPDAPPAEPAVSAPPLTSSPLQPARMEGEPDARPPTEETESQPAAAAAEIRPSVSDGPGAPASKVEADVTPPAPLPSRAPSDAQRVEVYPPPSPRAESRQVQAKTPPSVSRQPETLDTGEELGALPPIQLSPAPDLFDDEPASEPLLVLPDSLVRPHPADAEPAPTDAPGRAATGEESPAQPPAAARPVRAQRVEEAPSPGLGLDVPARRVRAESVQRAVDRPETLQRAGLERERTQPTVRASTFTARAGLPVGAARRVDTDGSPRRVHVASAPVVSRQTDEGAAAVDPEPITTVSQAQPGPYLPAGSVSVERRAGPRMPLVSALRPASSQPIVDRSLDLSAPDSESETLPPLFRLPPAKPAPLPLHVPVVSLPAQRAESVSPLTIQPARTMQAGVGTPTTIRGQSEEAEQTSAQAEEQDPAKLAQLVYPHLKRLIAIEQERQFGRWR